MTDAVFVALYDEKLRKKHTPITERQIRALELAAMVEECLLVDPVYPATGVRGNIKRFR